MTVTAIIAIVISMVIVIDESLTWPHTIVLENHTKLVSKSTKPPPLLFFA